MRIQQKIKFSFSKVSSQTIWECWNHNHTYDLYPRAQKNSFHGLYLFIGNQVWAFTGQNLEPGFPKPLSSFGLPASVTKVDAAVHNKNSGKTLLFFDKYYYRWVVLHHKQKPLKCTLKRHQNLTFPVLIFICGSYDERENRMDEGYSKRVENVFLGLNGQVTAAHMSNGRCF